MEALGKFVIFSVMILPVIEAGSLATLLNVTNIECPDKSPCPDHNTCCEVISGGYGCCSLENAVCCPDKMHCCPNGKKCSDDSCVDQQSKLTIFKTAITTPAPEVKESNNGDDGQKVEIQSLQASMLAQEVSSKIVPCPNPAYHCPDGTTCCLASIWVCCNLPHAVCCPDGLHCCPYGFHCDSTSSRCLRGNGSDEDSALFFLQSISARSNKKQQL